MGDPVYEDSFINTSPNLQVDETLVWNSGQFEFLMKIFRKFNFWKKGQKYNSSLKVGVWHGRNSTILIYGKLQGN